MNYTLDKRINIILNKILKYNKSDDAINQIQDIIIETYNKPNKIKKAMMDINDILNNNNMKEDIADRINKNHSFVSTNLSEIIKKNFDHDIKIVDIGGGEGDVIKNIGENLDISSKNLYCVEQNNQWTEYYKFNNKINYIFWNNHYIDIVDKSIDIVILMVSLHHMNDEVLHNTMKNIKRILKPKGIVIIKEHDMYNDDIKYTIDWEHHLYHIIRSENEELKKNKLKKYLNKFVNNYKSKKDYDQLFLSYGLKELEELNRQFKPISNIDYNNASNLYWKIYLDSNN